MELLFIATQPWSIELTFQHLIMHLVVRGLEPILHIPSILTSTCSRLMVGIFLQLHAVCCHCVSYSCSIPVKLISLWQLELALSDQTRQAAPLF